MNYTMSDDSRKTKVMNTIDNLQKSHDARASLQFIKTSRVARDKELNKDLSVQALWRGTKNNIQDMREEYETNIYNTMAQLASSGAFFEYQDLPASTFGTVVDDFEGCVMDCADGCQQYVDCGDIAAGQYFSNYNCCPDEDGDVDQTPVCDEWGCLTWGLTGCIEEC